MPVGFGRSVSLQALPNFVVGNSGRNASAKLNELKELDDLRGKLIVSNLGLVKDPNSESHETNLRSKKPIQELSLLWGPDSNEMKNSVSLVLLDNLCPHQNLRSLNVDGFLGVRFSDWIISLTNVVDINLFNLPNCKYLPPLERLPCLRKLKILYMGSLEWIHYYEIIGDVFFPSLEQLYFCNCENFRGWERLLGDDKNANETENHLSLPPFSRLSSLEIYACPNLTCMTSFARLIEKLELGVCSVKLMLETCMVKHDESSPFYPLSALKSLQLWQVTGIEAMPEDWMRNLT
ncbi:hypothetical protein PIB30_077568 [Stylosanthes scabra]|uniref:R13L1/DRL21-like LRR repeat region domain-containing protein n=1 Tax=Stylosanthes scabra TaxID=79078 RepID=A0ABU6QR65_9FABA|nr:hypothetical protein [Stylosanthes scabra]